MVIDLAARRRAGQRPPARHRRAAFYFDLADAGTYLAAERVERLSATVTWVPAALDALPRPGADTIAARAAALRMPLVWPEWGAGPVPRAMRAAAAAIEVGRGPAFVLAASRLAFCGGFDLDDPEVLAEAAAAAGLGLDDSRAAAGDPGRDAAIAAAGRFVAGHGADEAPVLQVGRTLFAGEQRLAAAAAALRHGTPGALRSHG
jgi:2-hydroxychromene-2-carboxylate isomerase